MARRYLLDTNILSYLVDTASPFHGAVHARLASLADEDEAALSVLSLYELHHWFAHDPAQEPVAAEIVRDFTILPLPEAGARRFGRLMRDLRARGARRVDSRRHAVDAMIAVTALRHGAVLVSNDTVFTRLAELAPDLEVMDWAAVPAR